MTVEHDSRWPDGPPLNGCSKCRRDFASLRAFDEHFGEDRRCDDLEEDDQWLLDARGRWTTQKLANHALATAERFARDPQRAVGSRSQGLGD